MDHGCDHEVRHVPSITAEERGLHELLLKDGKPGAERRFGLIGHDLAPLLGRKEDPMPEQGGQYHFDVVRNEECPLQHSTATLRRRWEERVLVLLGEVEIDRCGLPHHEPVVIDGWHATVGVERNVPRLLALRVRAAEGYGNVLIGNADLVCEPNDAERARVRCAIDLEHAVTCG